MVLLRRMTSVVTLEVILTRLVLWKAITQSGGEISDGYTPQFLWALDTLSIPAMSAECERVFSSAKKLITPERNALADNTIEACECLKAWWDQGLIRGQHDV